MSDDELRGWISDDRRHGVHINAGTLSDLAAEVLRLRAERDEAQALIYAARQERNAAEDQEKELAEELRRVKAERDRFETALARACLVGGTTYLLDRAQSAEARAEAAEARVAKPEHAETLAKEMQAIVAADRWKGRDLSAVPPEKWNHLRPETRQFWIETAARILSALKGTP